MNMRAVRPVLRPVLAPHDPLVRWCDRCESWAALAVAAVVAALLPAALVAGWMWGSAQYAGMVGHRHDVVAQVVAHPDSHVRPGLVEATWSWDGLRRTGIVAAHQDPPGKVGVAVDDRGRPASVPELADVRSSAMGSAAVLWMVVVAGSVGTVRAVHLRTERRRAAFWDAELCRFLGPERP
ncbi:hypothetical protein G4X40_11625 [Rhodococcus sp. D2-41]|uniref:Rv1733c family protein n=1 Tax=Speluncibacter jeojiensis TaxID=2710754 RepID=UPI0024103006|nr:hypothetical protein [Rhodococcus sp. D2-41]MDG3010798.1 hypothetical protein [Rhodococcus sp. D2-41]